MAAEMEELEQLEERIRRVSDVIRGLRHENSQLASQLKEAREQVRKSEETLSCLQEENRRNEDLTRQLQLLQEERQEIRGRVTRMLETFSGIDEMQVGGHADN